MSASNMAVVSKRSTKTPLFSDQQIRKIAIGRSDEIADWARSTASKRGISVRRLPNDKFVKAVSRLSDGVVDLDPVEELLVALGRAGGITSFQRGLLQVHYLR
jgi:hypothetical protein